MAENLREKLKYISAPKITRCIFCGSKAPLTNEHIFPAWSHRYLPPPKAKKYESARGVRNPEGDDRVFVIKRPGDIRHWQIACVCERRCNNGWMRKLIEDRARPILIPLIRGEEIQITPDQQSIIASWAALKSMVAEFNINDAVSIHHSQRKRLMNKQIPPVKTWGIWIGHFVTDALKKHQYLTSWESHPFLMLPDKFTTGGSDKKATHYNSHTSTQVIGQLFIQVLHSPMPNLIPRWRFSLPDKGTLFRIWPPSKTNIRWPGKPMTDRDAFVAANSFMSFILKIQARERAEKRQK